MRYIDIRFASAPVQARLYGHAWAGHYAGYDFDALRADVEKRAAAVKASDAREVAKARRLEALRREYRDIARQEAAAAKFAIQAKG